MPEFFQIIEKRKERKTSAAAVFNVKETEHVEYI
jgi:hypothetical protein